MMARMSSAEVINPVPAREAPAWLRAMVGPFLDDPRGPDIKRWEQVLERVWEPARAWGARDRGRWVATLRSEARTLTVPGLGHSTRDQPVDAVTNVTVTATHRRRGLMSEMLTASMRAARDRGDAVSILIPAEWPIYGRFGYAPAAWRADYVLHRSRPGATLAGDVTRVRQVDLDELGEVAPAVFDAARREHPGQVDRAAPWWEFMLGRAGFPEPGGDELPHNWLVHDGEDGPDGILGWRATREGGYNPPLGRADVWALASVGEAAYADLWAYLTGIDLIDELALTHRPLDEPARWLLADGRTLVLSELVDYLWLRLLDVSAALAARRYAVDGELVLEVTDDATAVGDLGVSGRYALRAAGNAVECAPTDRAADLALDQRALAAIYLGGNRLGTLSAAGAARELTGGALRRAGAMFSTPRAPWNATSF